jgi:hypothetical protein
MVALLMSLQVPYKVWQLGAAGCGRKAGIPPHRASPCQLYPEGPSRSHSGDRYKDTRDTWDIREWNTMTAFKT